MSHLDDEAVASLAVGDDQDATAAIHAAECPECTERVEHMRTLADRIGALGRTSGMLTPPDRVWEQIANELGDELLAGSAAEVPPATGVTNLPVAGGDDRTEQATASADATEDFITDLSSRRDAQAESRGEPGAEGAHASHRSYTPWLIGVAAGVVGVVVGGGIVAGILDNSDPTGSIIAQAALTDLATEADAGTARVETLDDGREVLVVDTTTDFEDVSDGYLEVWLIDPNIEGMVSLGHLTQANEEFVIPNGYSVAAFPIVDISVEPLDGVPTHSGDSVTRGVLES
ncbi:anti-sigma factor [Demequina aurantiaca]|uniref:anti-sigma factor n=1 Tax=Demequina aurantiaca TaxID=676200 RepID=UPI0007825F74|nr:anti-sigma factor [Demequina aurantiaca]